MTRKAVGFSTVSSISSHISTASVPMVKDVLPSRSAKETGQFFFASVPQALGWSAEVLRHRRFPKISSALRDGLAIERRAQGWALQQAAEADGRSYIAGIDYILPSDADDKNLLAGRVWQWLAEALTPAESLVLRLRFFGDYHDEAHLARALREQALFHQKGLRVALRYTMTFRDIGALTNVDPKTAYRRLEKALLRASGVLSAQRVLLMCDAGPREEKAVGQ